MSDRLSGTPGTANGRRRPRGGAAGVWGLGSTVALKTVHGEQPKADTLGIRLSARPGDLAYRVSTLSLERPYLRRKTQTQTQTHTLYKDGQLYHHWVIVRVINMDIVEEWGTE